MVNAKLKKYESMVRGRDNTACTFTMVIGHVVKTVSATFNGGL